MLSMTKKNHLISSIFLFIFALTIGSAYIYYDSIIIHTPTVKEIIPKEVHSIDPEVREVRLLATENSDLAGYLIIEGTNINYPVMYTKDEDYYLYRDFYKRDYPNGSLYIDKHNILTPRDTNLIIHGHSMNDGSMFTDLLNYKDEDYYRAHKIITYYTPTQKEEYEIIGVIVSEVYTNLDDVFKYYKFYRSTSEEEYNNYILNIKKLSLYNIDTTAYYGEDLLTLSTCEYSRKNGRLAVVAKRIT